MAHEYAIALINSDCEMQFDKFIQLCWNYADAMQTQADKREKEEQSEHVFEAINEWQPDWSDAPEWANWWAIDKDLVSFWFADKPKFDEVEFYQCGVFCDAPSFGYTGDWRNSLRKRPK